MDHLEGGVDRDPLPLSSSLKGDEAIYHSKESIIPSQADIQTRSKSRPPLPDNDGACSYLLARGGLDPQPLGSRIPSIP